MMESSFQLLICLKTPKCFEVFGEFSIGSDRDTAYLLFYNLQGNEAADLTTVFHIDLIETQGVLPKKIRTSGSNGFVWSLHQPPVLNLV